MRFILPLMASIVISISLFGLMQWLIKPSSVQVDRGDEVAMVGFIRSLQDSETQQKNRAPKEPQKPEPLPLASPMSVKTQAQNFDVSPQPLMASALTNFKSDATNGLFSGLGSVDSDVTPLVQIEPRYPAQALARKIEGYVVIEFSIDATGGVTAVSVLDAQPKGVFEREAIKAAWRYRFKPKIVDGKPTAQIAKLPFEFSLEGQ